MYIRRHCLECETHKVSSWNKISKEKGKLNSLDNTTGEQGKAHFPAGAHIVLASEP